jgi:hypothetical protein
VIIARRSLAGVSYVQALIRDGFDHTPPATGDPDTVMEPLYPDRRRTRGGQLIHSGLLSR